MIRLYHGTRPEHEDSIRRHGLREPTDQADFGGSMGVSFGVWLSPNRQVAIDSGKLSTARHVMHLRRKGHSPADVLGVVAAGSLLVHVELPESAEFMLAYDDHRGWCLDAPCIPPQHLVGFERVRWAMPPKWPNMRAIPPTLRRRGYLQNGEFHLDDRHAQSRVTTR